MKQRGIAFLLSFLCAFSIAGQGVLAYPSDYAGTAYVKEAAPSDGTLEDAQAHWQDGRGAEPGALTPADAGYEEEAWDLPTGLLTPEFREVTYEELPEEALDSTQKSSAVYSCEWDKYSTNYYYNQLSANEQAFWDKLDQECRSYLLTTKNALPKRDSQGYLSYPMGMISFSNISKMQAQNVLLMFLYSNPQYYFLDMAWYWGIMGGQYFGIQPTVHPTFASGQARSRATAQIKALTDGWLAQINAQPDVLAKERLAHDLICEKMEYDYDFMNVFNQGIYSVFCTNSTVCAGYSQAMQFLMNGAGIDCAVVTSAGDESLGLIGHEWNIIRLNNAWYYVDLTWDDNIADDKGAVSAYTYFNKSMQNYLSEENLMNVMSHTTEGIWDGYLPPLVYDSGATETDPGTLHAQRGSLTLPAIAGSGSRVTIAGPAGAVIYYTTNGSVPSVASTRAKKYTGPIALTGTTTVKAVAVLNGYHDSQVAGLTVTPRYTVSFHANGGYIGSKSVGVSTKSGQLYNTALGGLPTPKRKGYLFLGWYSAKSGGSKIQPTSRIVADASYYAHWAKINPKKVKVSSVKNSASRTVKVKIKKAKNATSYQVRYSTKKNMASAKKQTVAANSCTIKKLKKGKTYYVQARMCQRDSATGKDKCGPWSKAKTVKVVK